MEKIYKLFILGVLVCTSIVVQAQMGSGSMTVDNSIVNIAAGTTEMRFSEGSYFGPDADWTIDGTLEIYSKNLWIAPGATFKGTGKIIIYNPGSNPFYIDMASGPTMIDGNNGAFIGMLIEHRNNDNIVLADVNDPGYNTNNPQGSLAATLNIGGELDLAVNKANIILNGHNLAFDAGGKISNYSASRMVVTSNSIAGYMIKHYGNSNSFVFPVGIAEGDYTPATLAPSTAGTLFVSVQDYAASSTFSKGLKSELGMDRSWQIYSEAPLKVNITLQHNQSTNGQLFKDANAEVAEYTTGTKWNLLKTINPAVNIHSSMEVDMLPDLSVNTLSDVRNAVRGANSGTGVVKNARVTGGWFTKYALAEPNFFIPNVITPNGDGKNDRFVIVGLEFFDNAQMTVFNRWGNEVYRNNNYKNTWAGDGLSEGTYYYLIKLRKGDKVDVYKSWVLIK